MVTFTPVDELEPKAAPAQPPTGFPGHPVPIGDRGEQFVPPPGKGPTFTPLDQPPRPIAENLSQHHLRLGDREVAIPAGIDAPLKMIYDFSRGFNNMLAHALGEDLEQVDNLVKWIAGEGFFENPGDGVALVKRGLSNLGIRSDGADTLMREIGKETFQQGLLASVLYALAPAGVGMAARGPISGAIRDMSKFALERPGATAAGELGAVAGGVAAAEGAPEPWKELARMVGGMFGGGLGMGAATRGVLHPEGRLPSKLHQGLAPDAPGEAVLRTRSPDYSAISSAVEGDKLRVEQAIDRAVSSVRAQGDPLVAADRMRTGARDAYDYAQRVEAKNYWDKVDKSIRVDTAALKEFAAGMVKEVAKEARADFLPGGRINQIRRLPKTITLDRALQFRSTILKDLRAMQLTPDQRANDTLMKNLGLLQGKIIDDIVRQNPNNDALAKAREFSTWVHDRFTRGPLANFAQVRQQDTALPDVGRAADRFIGGERAGDEIAEVAGRLDRPAMAGDSEAFVRERFREAADADPRKGLRWLESTPVQRFIRAFPKLEADMKRTSQQLRASLDEQDTINRSSFLREAGEQPQTAVDRLFTSGQKVQNARRIVQRIGHDDEAMSALRDATITKLINETRGRPEDLIRRLNARDTRAMLSEILPSDTMARFERIAETAQAIGSGGEHMGQRVFRQTVGRGARVIGALFGRWLGTGTLQAPEQGANIVHGLAEGAMVSTMSPERMLVKAVLDPKWERFLYSRLPENITEWRRTSRQLQGLLAAGQGLDQAAERQ